MHMHTCTYTLSHTHTHAHTNAQTYTHTHMRTHLHQHTHTWLLRILATHMTESLAALSNQPTYTHTQPPPIPRCHTHTPLPSLHTPYAHIHTHTHTWPLRILATRMTEPLAALSKPCPESRRSELMVGTSSPGFNTLYCPAHRVCDTRQGGGGSGGWGGVRVFVP